MKNIRKLKKFWKMEGNSKLEKVYITIKNNMKIKDNEKLYIKICN